MKYISFTVSVIILCEISRATFEISQKILSPVQLTIF